MSKNSEIIIVGGGMAGCLAAYYLIEAGAQVTVIESRGIGTQASGKSAGGLNPLHGPGIPGPLSSLAMDSFQLHQKLWPILREESAIEFFPRIVKRLFLAFKDEEIPGLETSGKPYGPYPDFTAEIIDRGQVLELEPRIHSSFRAALYTEGNGAVDPQTYCEAIAEVCAKRGCRFVTGEVTGLQKSDERITGVTVGSDMLSGDHFVLATGPWGKDASDWAGINFPVEPFKGEMLLVELPEPNLQYDITYSGKSLFVRGDNRVWVGATETHEGFNVTPTETAYQNLREAGGQIMPVIADAVMIEQTVGLRPATPDNLPIIGAAPGFENLYVSLGAGTKGTLITAGMGKAIAELITKGQTDHSINFASPGRFNI